MTPIQYCYDKITTEKSSVYYVLKKIPASKRDAIVAVAVFYQELEKMLLTTSDTMLAQQQLHWWRDEIVRVLQKQATHPVTLVLQSAKVDTDVLLSMIDGMEQWLAFRSFQSFEDLVVHIMRTAGKRELLFNQILETSVSDEVIYQLSLVLELVNYIQHFHAYVQQNFLMMAEDEMQQFQVRQEHFYAYKTTAQMKNLFDHQAKKIESAFGKAKDSLNTSTQDSINYLLARCDIALATLHEIQKSGYPVLEQWIALTPLKKWWLAYKS